MLFSGKNIVTAQIYGLNCNNILKLLIYGLLSDTQNQKS